jgi:hypothetical protein
MPVDMEACWPLRAKRSRGQGLLAKEEAAVGIPAAAIPDIVQITHRVALVQNRHTPMTEEDTRGSERDNRKLPL